MNEDILEVVYIVLMQAAEDMEADLKAIMDEVRRRNERLCRWRKLAADLQAHRLSPAAADKELIGSASDAVAGQLTSLLDLTETMQMRLQMVMERRTKFIEALSNMMKKQSDTASTIIGNLK